MIGPKKLSSIRQELQAALKAAGEDPIRWLEQRMAAPQRRGVALPGESEVLSSLRRFLEAPRKEKRRKQRLGTKK
jgi:hypothetical protein